MKPIHVTVSSCHTGVNPAPGIGIARSLKAAYPDCFLTGKDQSAFSSGLHSEYFDDIWITRPWSDLDMPLHIEQIRHRLDASNGYFLPGSDLEARWLASADIKSVLIPPAKTFERTVKPFEKIIEILPVKVPEFMDLSTDPRDIYNFAVTHGWKVWLKGPVMDARRVYNWPHFQATWDELLTTWGRESFFLQREITGLDVSVAIAAHHGKLLGAAFMEKRQITAEGKCWAGDVTECPADLFKAIENFARQLNWTGGGELEFVRDASGQLWFIDLNYRFPAWIHGATLAGINLPGLLIEAVSGVTAAPATSASRQFTRLVLEIPVLNQMQLPAPPTFKETKRGAVSGKLSSLSPGGLPQLMQRLSPTATSGAKFKLNEELNKHEQKYLPKVLKEFVLKNDPSDFLTPNRLFLAETAEAPFKLMRKLAAERRPVRLSPAYSIKTNPDRRLMEAALKAGFRAEGISMEELLWAREVGFRYEDMVYNGPVPLVEKHLEGQAIHVVFADSIESFVRLCKLRPLVAKNIGLRLRPFDVNSRFGLQMESLEQFKRIAAAVREHLPSEVGFGIHQHQQSSITGQKLWLRQTQAFLEQARTLENICGRKVSICDIGGGWTSESFQPFVADVLAPLLGDIQTILSQVQEVIIEPGKAICEQSQVLVARVLERRGEGHVREVVADACLAELPLAVDFARNVYHLNPAGKLTKLTSGVGRILGRVCMEHDILANGILLPAETREGDFLIFSHAGAYEASMSYRFGTGSSYERQT